MHLPILKFPDPFLKKAVPPVDTIDATIVAHLDNMLETMYAENGVGLAATQVGLPWQLVVIDVSEDRNSPLFLINPSIIEADGDILSEEGCLSFPGTYVKVRRKKNVTVKFLNKSGKEEQLAADGLLSICLQHEIDHLKGITFIDHLSPLKRSFVLKKLQKHNKITL